MKQFFLRLIAKTPKFFKRFQAFALSLSALGAALQAVPNLPERLDGIAETLIWLGAVMAAIAQFAVSNTSKHVQTVNTK